MLESHAGRQSQQGSAPVLAGLFRLGRERHALALRHAEHRSVAPQRQLTHQRLCGKNGRWGHPALMRPRRLIGRGGAQLGAARGVCSTPGANARSLRRGKAGRVLCHRRGLGCAFLSRTRLPVCLSVCRPACLSTFRPGRRTHSASTVKRSTRNEAACAKALHAGAPLSWPPSTTDCRVVETSSSRPHHRSRQQE